MIKKLRKDKEELFVPCDCCGRCTILSFNYDENEWNNEIHKEVYISAYKTTWHEVQGSVFDILFRRIKQAWLMLIGKEYLAYEIVLEEENITKLKDWFSDL